uniref:Putative ovule protein n=1 Tax=Solanum chacoense TaxID=4108 RepID=A0A0V0GQ87_SOLCH
MHKVKFELSDTSSKSFTMLLVFKQAALSVHSTFLSMFGSSNTRSKWKMGKRGNGGGWDKPGIN